MVNFLIAQLFCALYLVGTKESPTDTVKRVKWGQAAPSVTNVTINRDIRPNRRPEHLRSSLRYIHWDILLGAFPARLRRQA